MHERRSFLSSIHPWANFFDLVDLFGELGVWSVDFLQTNSGTEHEFGIFQGTRELSRWRVTVKIKSREQKR